jgi:stage V sporulation protein G
MNITDVRVKKLEGKGRTKAVASITIDNAFAVHDIRVIEGKEGPFVSMPSRKNEKTGDFSDICHPINTDTRNAINKAILDEYNK